MRAHEVATLILYSSLGAPDCRERRNIITIRAVLRHRKGVWYSALVLAIGTDVSFILIQWFIIFLVQLFIMLSYLGQLQRRPHVHVEEMVILVQERETHLV